jgi:xylose isomerase
VDTVPIMQEALARLGLSIAAINVNIKGDPVFVNGALSSPDAKVRAKAIEFIKGGKDMAAAMGADKITCAPLNDGYDYCFQVDYRRAWQRMVDSVKEAAAYRPEVPLFLEYKPSEPRVHCLLDSTAKSLVFLDAVGNGQVGITLDIGHAIYGGESPAEALALISMSGHPYYIHINDNNGKWDWDLMAGTCNLWNYVEFLYYLKELRYEGWVTSDTSPVRQDSFETFAFNVRFTNKIWHWLDSIDRDFIRRSLEKHEFMAILKLLEPHLFGSAGQENAGGAMRTL